MTVHLLFLPYYKIVHHFHFLLATTSCKNVETLYRKTKHHSQSHICEVKQTPSPSLPRTKRVVPPKFKACSRDSRGGGGVPSTTRTQRRPISLNEVQCLKYFCNWL